MATVYLIRHANPDWTRKELPYHLPPGPPLTQQGELEASALGLFLKQARVAQIYTSPLERCLITAQIAAAVANCAIETLPELIEWQPGEEYDAIRVRLWPVFQMALTTSHRESPVALVTHGGPIGCLLKELGMDDATLEQQRTFDHRNPLPPAGAWEVSQTSPDAPWVLRLAFIPAIPLEF